MSVMGLLARPSSSSTGRSRKVPAVAVVLGVSIVAAAAFLLAPPMGIDLAAQVAHADFWSRHGAAVIDFGWYGGTSPYGYSLLTPALMAWLGGGTAGAEALGALAATVASVVLTLLLVRTDARRPLVAGLLGALGIFGNIVSGRVTFTVGLAFGLAALLALTDDRPWVRRGGGVAAGVVAACTSPVAGLFLGLAGTALLLSGGRRRVDGLLLAVAAGVPTVVMGVLFGTGGPMNTIDSDTLRSFTVSVLVAVLVPHRPVRIGALLSAGGVLAAAVLTTPVGLNAGRLSATFALATIAGYAVVPARLRVPEAWRRPVPRLAVLAALLAGVALWQHPVAVLELRGAGNPTASPGYFRPLLDELARREPAGRIEVVPTVNYWEAAYVPGVVPLARGWLRQADTDRNPVFFEGRLTASGYERWLRDTGVSLVALADAPAASVARQEAKLVRAKPPYLRKVWRGGHWTLYEVLGKPSVVAGAQLVSSTDGGVVVDVAVPGAVQVRVRWSRWLALEGPAGCLEPAAGGWTTIRAAEPGRYTVTGSLVPRSAC
ncbi:hypothetical protein AB0J80_09350 [Actinoplanes sp. NPDC049548]|uniref:hypothetical protein n=1 Tax=Actinoplanes sp. NPDC049548 TaxID=3155152 RepID=UPI00341674E8